ncbi:MAG: TonB-dependent receptor [Candidatus Thiodiazotropha sp.]
MMYTTLALLLAASFKAQAQSPLEADREADELPSITVTATRVESGVQDTPSAVTVIGREELERVKFVDSRMELMKRIPGYSMVRNLRIPIGGKNYTINLIDGLSIGSAFGSGTIGFADSTNSLDIERVEVIRGPASALYGSNALGGVINIITKEPPLEPEYRLWAEAGEYHRQRAGVSAAGTVGSVGYFFDANNLDYAGWRERSDNQRKQVSGKLLFETDEMSLLTLRAEYLDTYLENPGSLNQLQYEENWQQAVVPDAYNDEQAATLSAKYERDLSNHSGIDISYGVRNTKAEGPPSYSPTGGFSGSDVTNHNLVALYRHRFNALDAQLIVGSDLLLSESDSDTYTERTSSSRIAQHWEVTAINTSPFAQYEFSPVDRMRLSLGARYDRIRYSANGYKVSRGVVTEYDDSITFSHTSPKASVTFKLNKESSLWFGYGQGFVVPSRNYLFVGSGGYDSNPGLKPEKAGNYELGLRGRVRPARLSYDFVLYRTDIDDMLVADDNLDLYVNAGKVRVQGVETLLSWKPLKRWRFDLTHTYADNKYIDFVSGGTDNSGNTLSASPKHHLDARAAWMPVRGLEAELEWNHISRYHTSHENNDPQGEATRPDLFNLRVSYKSGPWSFWGHLLNLTDKKYAERVSYDPDDGRSFDVGGPRTLYAGVSYKW